MSAYETIIEKANGGLGSDLLSHVVAYDELTLTVARDSIGKSLMFLRDDPALRFVSFIDLTALDLPAREERFEVVWHLLSPTLNQRVRVKVTTSATIPVPSTASRNRPPVGSSSTARRTRSHTAGWSCHSSMSTGAGT